MVISCAVLNIIQSMDLSVIVPVYNAALLINRCLDSILSQQGEYEIEVICVDDGSTDNSIELIRSRKEKNIVLLTQSNSGPASARNKGMNVARGRYMAYLDADDYWLPDFIKKTITFLDNHKECIAVSVAQRHITLKGESLSPTYILEADHNSVPFILNNFFDFFFVFLCFILFLVVFKLIILKKPHNVNSIVWLFLVFIFFFLYTNNFRI